MNNNIISNMSPIHLRKTISTFLTIIATAKLVTCWTVTTSYSSPYPGGNSKYYMKENENLSLKCEFNSLNSHLLKYIRWTKFYHNSASSEQVFYSQGGGISGSLIGYATSELAQYVHVLKIGKFSTGRNVGLYQCVVCDVSVTCHTSTVNISAENVAVSPTVELLTAKIILYEGESLTMTCLVKDGYPTTILSYTWQFASIYNNSVQILSSYGDVMSVASISYRHYGTYTCKVATFAGTVSNETAIKVYYSPQLYNKDKEIIFVTIGSAVHLNVTFRASSQHNVTTDWNIVTESSNSNIKIPENKISLTKDSQSLDTYTTEVVFLSIKLADIGLVQCHIDNGVIPSKTKIFHLKFDIPIIDQQSLIYKRQDLVVTLSWTLPDGVYTEVKIEQCFKLSTGLMNCQKHGLDDQQETSLKLTEEHGNEYLYYMLVYQHNIEVVRSEAFSLATEKDDSFFGIIAGVMCVVVIMALVVPFLLIQIMDCDCLNKNQQKDESRLLNIVRRLKVKKHKKSKSGSDIKIEDLEKKKSDKQILENKQSSMISRNANYDLSNTNTAKPEEANSDLISDIKTINPLPLLGISGNTGINNNAQVQPKPTQPNIESNTITFQHNEENMPTNEDVENTLTLEKSKSISVIGNQAQNKSTNAERFDQTSNNSPPILIPDNMSVSKSQKPIEDYTGSQHDIYRETDDSSSEFSYVCSKESDIVSREISAKTVQVAGSMSNISSYMNSNEVIHKCGIYDKLENDTDSNRIHIYEL